jgi:hypothetical protein
VVSNLHSCQVVEAPKQYTLLPPLLP